MPNPGDRQDMTNLLTSSSSDSSRSDTPPSFMTPLAHAAAPTAPVSSVLPGAGAGAGAETPGYARPTGAIDRIDLDPVTVSALAADLRSVATTVGGADPGGVSDAVSAGMPGSDAAWACAAAEAALSSALAELHTRITAAGENVTASLETYEAADAANAHAIGEAGPR